MPRLLLALAFLVGASTTFGGNFSGRLPDALPDVSSWEQITGDVESDRMALAYLLYVNPRRGALYEVIRYQVRFLAPAVEAERRYSPAEKLVWNERPGHAHLRCFELTRPAPGGVTAWRELAHGTPEYQVEMQMVMQLLGLHRSLLLERGRR